MEEIQVFHAYLPAWACDLTIIGTSEGHFFLVKELCAVLGLKDTQWALGRLRERKALSQFVKQWAVPTRGGRQKTWCIHRRAIGIWWGTIDESRCRPEVQDQLVQLQIEVIEAADRAFNGMVLSGDPWRNDMARLDGDMADMRQLTLMLERRIKHIEGVVFGEDASIDE